MKNIFEVWSIGLNFKYVYIICVIHVNKQNILVTPNFSMALQETLFS